MFNQRKFLGVAILAGIVAAVVGIKLYMHHAFASGVDDWIREIPGLSVGEQTSDLWQDQVILRDVRFEAIASTPMHAKEVILYSDQGSSRRPERLHLAVKGFSVDISEQSPQGAPLLALGIDQLRGDLELDGEASPDMKEMRLHLFRLSFEGLFALEFSFHLHDIDAGNLYDLQSLAFRQPAIMDDIRVGYFRIAYRDHSLFAQTFQNRPLQPESMVQMALATNDRLRHISGFRDAAVAFLNKPAKLELLIAPEKPMRVADMKLAAAQQPERLHMQLTYHE